MPEAMNIMGMIGAFIGVAIMLAIGIQILGNSVQDCTQLPGYTTGVAPDLELDSTGWGLQCVLNQTQSQSGYQLLGIVLIVLAAVAILAIIRMLG